MSKTDKITDESMLSNAFDMQKVILKEYINTINDSFTEKVTAQLQLILSEQLEILKKLKTELLRRGMVLQDIAPAETISQKLNNYK